MKKLWSPCGLVLLLNLTGCSSSEVRGIGLNTLANLFLVIPVVGGMIIVIFLLNKFIVDKNGRTMDRLCSLVGVILFPLIFLVLMQLKFGLNWITVSFSLIVGGVIGWFSYTLDELLESFWEERQITIPATLGLITGGWLIFTMFTQIWLEGDMYITHTASTSRVIIERYTYHHRTDEDGNDKSYYSWDYQDFGQKTVLGDTFPQLMEDRDYKLGYGASGKRDRLGRKEAYRFIGGHFYSETDQVWRPFRWLLLSNIKIRFTTGQVQKVQSNFYGHPMRNAGVVKSYRSLPGPVAIVMPPLDNDLPPPITELKAAVMVLDFFRMLITEHEYRSFLYLFLAVFGVLATLAAFVAPLRTPIVIFLVCASVVVLLLLLGVAARTGAIGSFDLPRRRRSSGGGGFGGRSYSR